MDPPVVQSSANSQQKSHSNRATKQHNLSHSAEVPRGIPISTVKQQQHVNMSNISVSFDAPHLIKQAHSKPQPSPFTGRPEGFMENSHCKDIANIGTVSLSNPESPSLVLTGHPAGFLELTDPHDICRFEPKAEPVSKKSSRKNHRKKTHSPPLLTPI